MIIGSLIRLLKRARHIKYVMNQYQDVLTPGKYHILDNFRSACLAKPSITTKAEMNFPHDAPSRVREYVAGLLNKFAYINVKKRDSAGEYEAIYIANNYDEEREVKLFSYSNKKVLVICVSHADMSKQMQEYAELSNVYKMPAIAKNLQFSYALDVSMIDLMEFPGDEQALTTIAMTTVAYNQNVEKLLRFSVIDLISSRYDDSMNNYLCDLSKDIHKDVLGLELPVCIQHGDLSKDNLIFGEADGEEAFWWIDWEHIKERVFFYDYFFYIINSAVYDDTGAFNCYICGRNDTTLKTFFGKMGLVYDPNKKWDYFLVFAIIFLKERVCDLGNVSALKKYCELIEKLKAASDGIGL